jgi:hypothetical protein
MAIYKFKPENRGSNIMRWGLIQINYRDWFAFFDNPEELSALLVEVYIVAEFEKVFREIIESLSKSKPA